MVARITLTESDLFDEIRSAVAAMPSVEGAFTFNELREKMGLSVPATTKRLKALKSAGKLESIRVYREGLDGRNAQVPGYRLKGKR
jgi:DNA-binding Lrp family transcriptional regulator